MTLNGVKRKLIVIRRYFLKAVLIGALLAFASSLLINYGLSLYFIYTFVVAWISWTLTLAIVIPAVSNDDFSAS